MPEQRPGERAARFHQAFPYVRDVLAARDAERARAERAEADVARLREALEFYARESAYDGVFFIPCPIEADRGERARAALTAATDEEPSDEAP